jgi:WD40 repeat protein
MKYSKIVTVIGISIIVSSLFLSYTNLVKAYTRESNLGLSQTVLISSQEEFLLKSFIGHSSEVWDVDFSPDGSLLASTSSDNSILVWNITNGEIYRNLTGHLESVYSVAFHPTDLVLASGSFDRSVLVWNLTTGEIMHNFTGHISSIWSLEFSADGSYLASGSGDSTVRIWDLNSSTLRYIFTGHTDSVKSIAFHPNDTLLVTGSYDESIILWDLITGSFESIISNNTADILSLTFNLQGTELASGSQDNQIVFWDMVNIGTETSQRLVLEDWVRALAYSCDGYYLASGLQNGIIKIWDDTSKKLVTNITGHTQSIRNLDFHPSEPILASASGDRTVKLWNVTDLDKDNLPDSWEIENGLSSTDGTDVDSDLDSDGLSNFYEYQFGTNPQLVDTDMDQIPDEYEFTHGLNGCANDAAADTDQDGIPNLYEFLNNLRAGEDDSTVDSDKDGMPNLYEYENGLLAGVDDSMGDEDNDGLPNVFEYQYGLIIGINDANNDLDSDGLTNIEEYLLGTNPGDPDSDNDTFNDYLERSWGTNPTDSASNPITVVIGLLIILTVTGVLIFSVIYNYQSIKSKSIRIGRGIQTRITKIPDVFRPSSQTSWIQDLEMGKAIPVDLLTSALQVQQLTLPYTVKTALTPQRLTEKVLVLRSEMLLLEPVPPKEANCQMCMAKITDQHYFQCKDCKRFVCIHDYVDLTTVGRGQCPNCSGDLIMFPFSCKACNLDFSSISEISGKSGCPLCGYVLADQSEIISNVTTRLSPSKMIESLRDENQPNIYQSHKGRSM